MRFLLTTCSAIWKSLLERLISRLRRALVSHTLEPTERTQRKVTASAAQKEVPFGVFQRGPRTLGGVGKDRRAPLSTRLYLSSEDELRALFDPHLTTLDKKAIEVFGKSARIFGNYCFVEREEVNSRKVTAHLDS